MENKHNVTVFVEKILLFPFANGRNIEILLGLSKQLFLFIAVYYKKYRKAA